MVQLNLFENSINNQALRSLLAFSNILLADIFYLRLSEGNFERLKKHSFAYFNVWITLAIVFGVSTLTTKQYKTDEINDDTIKNYVYYGLLIGLLVYVPLYNWIISCGAITKFTHLLSLANTAFGVLLSSFTCLIVFLVSQKTGLLS
jgi:hypothetical protein